MNQGTLHPWHGVNPGNQAPVIVTAYIEITPFDRVKYELDKESGLLKVDRPQAFSNLCPALYGFIPKTYCGDAIGRLCSSKTGIDHIEGDGDPLDICILGENGIQHNNILLQCKPIGGFRMIDKGQADDKIIAVLKNDAIYGSIENISELTPKVLGRLKHYFMTYKLDPDKEGNHVNITATYDRDEAYEVIRTSFKDYEESFGNK